MVNAGTDLVGNGERQYCAKDITRYIEEAHDALMKLRYLLPESAWHEMEQRFSLFSFQVIPLPHTRNRNTESLYLKLASHPKECDSYTSEKPYFVWANEDRLIFPLGDWIERWKRLASADDKELEDSGTAKPRRVGAPKRTSKREQLDKQILRKWREYKACGRSRADLADDMGITLERVELAQNAERKARRRTDRN